MTQALAIGGPADGQRFDLSGFKHLRDGDHFSIAAKVEVEGMSPFERIYSYRKRTFVERDSNLFASQEHATVVLVFAGIPPNTPIIPLLISGYAGQDRLP